MHLFDAALYVVPVCLQAKVGGRVEQAGDPVQEVGGAGPLPRHTTGAPHHPTAYLAV